MKIKNLEIKKIIKTTAVALVTGTCILTSSIGVMPDNVEASTYSQSYDVMYYFTDNLRENVEDYLDKTASSTNLNKLLGYYDTLYDFVNNGKMVRNTYYYNLQSYEQDELNYLLTSWGNEIYDKYTSKSYFKTNCKNKLGFYLKYDSQETGYDRDHEKTMEYYTETLNEELEDYLDSSNSQTNLKNALKVYKKVINFIEGNNRSYGYIFEELTITEKEAIINLAINSTYNIENVYGNYSYYSSTCTDTSYGPGWTVNINNFYRELGEYIGYTNEPISPTNPNIPNTQIPTIPNIPSTPEYTPVVPTVPTVPSVPTVEIPVQTIPGNNTVGKDWRANYIDPSINTSRGERDWTPENINDIYNNEDDYWRYTQDARGYYYQNGYYDYYGNFIPYNNYNNGYNSGYEPDYAPSKVLK